MSKGSSGKSKPSVELKLYSVDKGSTISNNQYNCSVFVTTNWNSGNAKTKINGTASQ